VRGGSEREIPRRCGARRAYARPVDTAPVPRAAHLEVLRRQLRHRYAVLARSLGEGVTEDLARRTLAGRPAIAWHAAHLADAIATCHRAVAAAEPARAVPLEGDAWTELRDATLALAHGFAAVLDALAPEDLGAPPAIEVHPAFRGTLTERAQFVEGHVFHVTYHVGSIAVLRASFGLA